MNPAIYALSYDVVREFEPILLIGSMPELIVAKKATPAKDLKGLIAWLRANPDKASRGLQASVVPGTSPGSFFRTSPAPVISSYPIAGLLQPWRPCWPARST